MRTRLRRTALVALLGSLSLAANQPTPPPLSRPDTPIVVEGDRLTPDAARERAVAFVRGAGIAGGDTPIARWVDPVCIAALGLAPRHSAPVEARIRRIAEAAGIELGATGCRPNVEIRFTADSNAELRRFEVDAPRRLAQIRGAERERLLADSAPVRWWYATALRSRDNLRASTAPATWMNLQGRSTSGAGSAMPDNVPGVHGYNSSLISTPAIRVLEAATVIVDISRFERMPLDAVAAYAAMVALAEIRQPDFNSSGSILGLFARSGAMPQALTEWDMAMLRALYRLPLDRDARTHRGILVRDLLAAVEEDGQGSDDRAR
jgi:hypothetical protein